VSRVPRFAAAAIAAITLAASLAAVAAAPRGAAVAYPEGYREWTHLKSMAIVSQEHPLFEAFGGIHHVYVNRKGLAAARAGGPYPDGSVLVFDLLAAERADGAYTEGARRFIGVMAKDRRLHADRRLGLRSLRGRRARPPGREGRRRAVLPLPPEPRGERLRVLVVPPLGGGTGAGGASDRPRPRGRRRGGPRPPARAAADGRAPRASGAHARATVASTSPCGSSAGT